MPKLKTIDEFKAKLALGGARSNLFSIDIPDLPTVVKTALKAGNEKFKWNKASKENLQMMCKAAQFPASNVGTVEVPFRGKILKVAGDRTVDTWTITIINDENYYIRYIMEKWMQVINQYDTAEGTSKIDGDSIFTDALVYQLDRSGTKSSAVYKFYDIWPSNISDIALSYDSTDTIEEFTVEFQVHRWEPYDSSDITNLSGAPSDTDSETTSETEETDTTV